MTTKTGMQWTARKILVKYVADTMRGIPVNDTNIEERLTDIARSGLWISDEAHKAIHNTSDAQWERLVSDVLRLA